MSEQQLLSWRNGNGVLVFSGGYTAGSPIRAAALAKAKDYGVAAYISTADDSGDALKDDMEDLGARSGYFINPLYDSPEEIVEQLEIASLIAIECGSSLDELYQMFQGSVQKGLEAAYERGALLLIEGLAINLFGRRVINDRGELLDGLNWVENAFLEPESGGIADSRAVQAVMERVPDTLAINIKAGSALALGDTGQIELLGDKQVTISLGIDYIDRATDNPNGGNPHTD